MKRLYCHRPPWTLSRREFHLMKQISNMNSSTITILGLGAMGSRMARRLLEAGHEVTVYNRSPEPAAALEEEAARPAPTPCEAAAASDLVISMVTDDDASRAVWLGDDGAAHGLREGAVALESSTCTPAWVRELAGHVEDCGAAFLDAPVLGSRPQAEDGALAYLVGGDADVLDEVRPVLEELGSAIHHAGPTGRGALMKLAVNALFGVQAAALGELLGLVRAAGMDEGRAAEILGALPVVSPAAKGVLNLMQGRDFAPRFPIDLVEKDFRYALQAAQEAGADLPVAEAVRRVFAKARDEGFGADNISGVARLFGVEA